MKKVSFKNYPEWITGNKKYIDLQLELTAIEKSEGDVLRNRQAQASLDKLDREALQLLNGVDLEQMTPQSVFDEKLLSISRRKSVLRRAIEMQKKNMQNLESDLSKKICDEIRPEYKRIVSELAEHARKLEKVVEQEQLFRNQLDEEGISWSGHVPACFLAGIGTLADDQSRISWFIRDAKALGYVK